MSQLPRYFLFLLKTFALNVDTMLRLKYLGYDRAYDLHPFLVSMEVPVLRFFLTM